MATLAWPATWLPVAWELRLVPNTRQFTSPYNNNTQVLDLGGERWRGVMSLPPPRSVDEGLAREAYFDQLAGGVNNVALWHFRAPQARGTAFTAGVVSWPVTNSGSAWPITNSGSAWFITDGTVVLRSAVSAGANTVQLQTRPGRTALAGTMLGIGGQLVRVNADATADGAGVLTLSVGPRARTAWAAYSTALVTDRPTATFQITGEVPTQWVPGAATGATFDALEVINL
jgi:hypothetical protein